MAQSENTTIDERITQALCGMRGCCGAAGSLAGRLKTGVSVVRAALDRMVREGKLDCRGDGNEGVDVFRPILDGRIIGSLPPRLRHLESGDADVEDFSVGHDSEDDPGERIDFALVRAAALWKSRMGDQRWHDDPRALAERPSGREYLPFTERR